MTSKNPYEVLGISPNASDDEVKRAYRDMTRKYHPDANVNNPLADLAEEKFKEVQEAYDEIMRQRAQGGYQSNGGYQGGGYSYNSGYGTEQNPQIQAFKKQNLCKMFLFHAKDLKQSKFFFSSFCQKTVTVNQKNHSNAKRRTV